MIERIISLNNDFIVAIQNGRGFVINKRSGEIVHMYEQWEKGMKKDALEELVVRETIRQKIEALIRIYVSRRNIPL